LCDSVFIFVVLWLVVHLDGDIAAQVTY
jgi:hypothetical protein